MVARWCGKSISQSCPLGLWYSSPYGRALWCNLQHRTFEMADECKNPSHLPRFTIPTQLLDSPVPPFNSRPYSFYWASIQEMRDPGKEVVKAVSLRLDFFCLAAVLIWLFLVGGSKAELNLTVKRDVSRLASKCRYPSKVKKKRSANLCAQMYWWLSGFSTLRKKKSAYFSPKAKFQMQTFHVESYWCMAI